MASIIPPPDLASTEPVSGNTQNIPKATATPNIADLPAPVTKADWAFALLIGLGINPISNPNSLASLIAQQNAEGTTGNLWNNPLATTLPMAGSTSQNGDGVQKYTSWQQGIAANVTMLQQDDPALVTALQANSTPAQYGKVLESQDWEGLGGSSYAPNVSYGQAVAGDVSSGGGLSADYQSVDPTGEIGQLSKWILAFGASGAVASVAGGSTAVSAAEGAISWTTQLGTILSSIASNWNKVLAVVLGGAVVLIAIYILFHSQINSAAETGAKIAAI